MSEPLNIPKTITFWLEFKNDESAPVQIDEPIGFDSAEFVALQDKNRYGRDVSLSGEEIDFNFPNTTGSRYGFQFDKLIEFDDVYGYESEVLFIIKNDGNDFIVGQIDFFTKETDRDYYFKCKMIQETTQQLLKRRAKTEVDLFAEEDLDGNEIDSVETSNILLLARPVDASSKWEVRDVVENYNLYSRSRQYYHYNPCQNLVKSDIDDSLTFLTWVERTSDSGSRNRDASQFRLIEAQSKLQNVKIRIQNLEWSQFTDTDNGGDGYCSNKLILAWGDSMDNLTDQVVIRELFLRDDESGSFDVLDETYTIDSISRGQSIYLFFFAEVRESSDIPGGKFEAFTSINEFTVDVDATTIGINSFTKGIRLIDGIKQINTNINTETPLIAPRFENGGEWYNNFIFDGNMLRGRETKFVMKWDSVSDLLMEFNGDFEIGAEELFIGKYDDFYQPIEIGAFLLAPDESLNLPYNELYAINKFSFGYKDFDQDKDDEDTIDGMHTMATFSLKNKQVENEKEIEVDFIRDAYMIETTRRKSFKSKASGKSSLSQDKKLFMVDVVDVEEGQTNTYTDLLFHAVLEDGRLQIRNNGDYNFTLMGFSIGDYIDIENTDNSNSYRVEEMQPTYITLNPTGFISNVQGLGEQLTEFTYPYSNIDYIARTSEDFDSITGISAPEYYVNLLYTPKRNILNNWASYLATCSLYNNEDITIQSFVNEPELVTTFNGGNEFVENSNITQEQLGDPILTARIINTKVICDFSTYQKYVKLLQTERGFVRVYDNNGRLRKGFPMESRYSWKDNILQLKLEEVYESELLQIGFNYGADSYVINRAGYSQAVLPDLNYQTNGEYIQLVDILNRPLSVSYKYDKVTVQGQFFDNITDLATAISIL